MDNRDLETAPSGYRRIARPPSRENLQEYYRNKYYQEGRGSYELEYSPSEIEYIRNRQRAYEYCLESLLGLKLANRRVLDMGCGEGWTVAHFAERGCRVTGVDFSSFGFRKFNPAHIACLREGDLYEIIRELASGEERFDVVFLNNVVEHVVDPESMLRRLAACLTPVGMIVATFPNDFSPLQALLLARQKIPGEFWIAPPDHLSYFNKETFSAMCRSLALEPQLWLADFPIDLFLLNDHANYVVDRAKGKQAHLARVECMNLMHTIDFRSTVRAFVEMGSAGFGRDLTAFVAPAGRGGKVGR